MLPLIACVLAGVSLAAEPPTLASVRQEIITAHRALRDPTEKARDLGSDARIDEGNKLLLDTFPQATRTPAQAFCLGNLLFKLDPQAAYALHKQAAAGLPEIYPNPQLEWAMVQHRAGEYAGAAAAYRKYTKAKPNEAVPFGLLAECLIRTGDLAGAVEAWETSESAQDGTLTDLETQVCEVHTADSPLLKRSLLAKKVREGDAAAAAELLAFDLNFPRDWWNIGPDPSILEHDVPMVERQQFKDDVVRQRLIAAHALLADLSGEDGSSHFTKANYILDPKASLPSDAVTMAAAFRCVVECEKLTIVQIRERCGKDLLERAKTSTDPVFLDAVAAVYVEMPELREIDLRGWEVTKQAKFAESYMCGLAAEDKLTLEDNHLTDAVAQFPESSIIAAMVVRLRQKAGLPLKDALVAGIKAEYTHFSPQGLLPRPGAATLRQYFKLLANELSATAKP